MARVEIPIVVINSSTGLPVNGAAVVVTRRSNGDLAPWYTVETGGTASTAAMVTDANGRVNAWVERGAYNLAVTGSGITPYTEAWEAAPGGDQTLDALWVGSDVAARILGVEVLDRYTLAGAGSYTIGSVAATHNGKPGKALLVAHADVLVNGWDMSIRRGGTIVQTATHTLGANESGLVCAAYSFSALSGSQTWSVTVDITGSGAVSSPGTGLLVIVEQ